MRPFDLLINQQASASPYNGVYMPFSPAGVLVVKTLACPDPTFSTKMAPALTTRGVLFKTHLSPSGSFRNPKMTPSLPHELIDTIIDFVAIRETGTRRMQDLESCSLTAKSWTCKSQRYILEAITIPSFDRLLDWVSEVDLTTCIPSYVKTLTLRGDANLIRRLSPDHLPNLERHLAAFDNLECLNLKKVHLHSRVGHFNLILECFGLLGGKLKTLNLETCSLSPNAFQSILHLLPQLDNVSIANDCSVNIGDHTTLRPSLTDATNFRGSLVTGSKTLHEFVPCLLTVPRNFHRLVCVFSRDGNRLISECAAALQVLRLEGTFYSPIS